MHTTTRALGSLAAVAAVATVVGWTSGGERVSKPEFVTRACQITRHDGACRVALRYLAALDLDRRTEACRLLAPSTLRAAGGMRGCVRMLATASGIRIRYSLLGARATPLGTTIRFTTQGRSDAPVLQDMIVSSAGRIVLVLPVGLYEPAGHALDV